MLLNIVYVQAQAPCGTITTAEEMQAFYNRAKPYLNSRAGLQEVKIPVVYHLTAENDGTGAYTIPDVLELHCSLNEDFASAEITFYILDIVQHNNSYYHHMEDAQAGSAMFFNENNIDACNIYVVEEAKSGTNPVCGYSYRAEYSANYLNRNGIVIDKGCAGYGSTTLTHEMGHYLNLAHTFYGWEGSPSPNSTQSAPNLSPSGRPTERVNGANCTYSGDGFCDTPPDYISGRWTCDNGSTRSFTDPNGQTFTVDEKNFMSYSADNCQQYFKPQQRAEMNNAPSAYRTYLLSLQPPNTDPLGIATNLYPANNTLNLSPNPITFTWDSVPNATAYLIQFTFNNFYSPVKEVIANTNQLTLTDLQLNRTYKWRVKAYNYGNVCSSFSTEKSFSTALFSTNIETADVLCAGLNSGTAKVSTSTTATSYKWYKWNAQNNTYTWFDVTNTNEMQNLAPNQYKVVAVASNGTESTNFFIINDKDELSITLAEQNNRIIATVVGGTKPYNYAWSNGSVGIINANPQQGENTLNIIDANGCTISKSIQFSGSVSIAEVNDKLDFSIYPNPLVNNNLTIAYKNQANQPLAIELIDLNGKLLLQKENIAQSNENSIVIDIPSLNKGVYYLKIQTKNQQFVHKLLR